LRARGGGVRTEQTDEDTIHEEQRIVFSEDRTEAAVSMPILSRESTLTASSTMSRQSSLTDKDEREARQVLMMRRKRAIALSRSGVGRGNSRRPSVHRFGSSKVGGVSIR